MMVSEVASWVASTTNASTQTVFANLEMPDSCCTASQLSKHREDPPLMVTGQTWSMQG